MPATRPEPLTVVLVHRNEAARCAATGRAFSDQGVPLRLVVVDNASTPDQLDRVRAALPQAEILALPNNQGFGPAANVGFRHWLASGEGDWVALAPHDVLPEPGCLERLLDAARRRPRAGLASAEFGVPLKPVVDPYFGGILMPSDAVPGWEDAGHPHGSLMIARRACLEDVGLFDERYFAYCEEADLGLRARAAGWEVGVVWGAIVRNTGLSSPVPVVEYLQHRNSLLLVRSHFGRYKTFIRACFAAVNTTRLLLRPASRTPTFDARARVRGILDFVRGRFGPPPPDLLQARPTTATLTTAAAAGASAPSPSRPSAARRRRPPRAAP